MHWRKHTRHDISFAQGTYTWFLQGGGVLDADDAAAGQQQELLAKVGAVQQTLTDVAGRVSWACRHRGQHMFEAVDGFCCQWRQCGSTIAACAACAACDAAANKYRLQECRRWWHDQFPE